MVGHALACLARVRARVPNLSSTLPPQRVPWTIWRARVAKTLRGRRGTQFNGVSAGAASVLSIGTRSPAECHRSFKDAAPARRRRSLSLQTRIPRPRRNQSSQPGRPLRTGVRWTGLVLHHGAGLWRGLPGLRPPSTSRGWRGNADHPSHLADVRNRTPHGAWRRNRRRRARSMSGGPPAPARSRPPVGGRALGTAPRRHPAPRYQTVQRAGNPRRPRGHPGFRTDRRDERARFGTV